ncbi:MAG TPA: kelch repeat-containing protein [Anaerolineae bacterium]|nr:kelch repeat-containing protein [Anaerolineae bacterium]
MLYKIPAFTLLCAFAVFVLSACASAAPTATPEAMMGKTPDAMTKPTDAMVMEKTPDTMTKPTDAAMMEKTPNVMAHPTEAMMKETPDAMAHPTDAAMMMEKFAWQQINTSNAPDARYDHALAYDSAQQRIVLFGGRTTDKTFGDTWIYDLKTGAWRQVNTPGPSPRFGLASVYDPKRKMVYLFGGQNKDFYNDTWAFDTIKETWQEVKTDGAKPDIRYGHGVALDTISDRLIVSHGFAKDGRHDDTWALDLNTNQWSNITPQGTRPLKRCLLETAFAPASDTLYLFGGCSSGFGPCPQGDLWALDKTGKWTQIQAPGGMPSARENPALVYDDQANRLILFGGKGGGTLDDLWVYYPDKNMWEKIAVTGPSGRSSPDAVYDAVNHRVYLFGGNTANGAVNDLWVLDL